MIHKIKEKADFIF